MIDRMGLKDGFAVQLGCGHPAVYLHEGKVFCEACNEELDKPLTDEARMTEQDERNGADKHGEQ